MVSKTHTIMLQSSQCVHHHPILYSHIILLFRGYHHGCRMWSISLHEHSIPRRHLQSQWILSHCIRPSLVSRYFNQMSKNIVSVGIWYAAGGDSRIWVASRPARYPQRLWPVTIGRTSNDPQTRLWAFTWLTSWIYAHGDGDGPNNLSRSHPKWTW
jgi:hypothetical protein